MQMMMSNQNHTASNPRLGAAMSAKPDSSIITVFEHQRLTAHDFVPASDFTWLLAQEFALFTIKRRRGQWQLKVGHYIGIILLPSGMTLEILPKPIAEEQSSRTQQPRQHSDVIQTRQWVQRMLSDLTNASNNTNSKLPSAKNLGQLSDDLAPLPIPAPPLSEWLVTQFLQRLSGYQPTKHYQEQIHNQSSLQGKLLIKEQLRRNSTQPHKFVCETSQLSQDMLSNRLIRSALLLVESMVNSQLKYGQVSRADRANNKNGYDSHHIQAATLFSIALSPWRQIAALSHHERRKLELLYGQAKRQLNVQPLSQQQLQAAQRLLDLAYWLLRQSSADTGSALRPQTLPIQTTTQPRLCLLIDMNQAFEQWASQCIARMFNQIDPSYQPLYQPQKVWLSDNAGQACLSVRPDLLIYRPAAHNATADSARIHDRVYSHVIDIKWKHLSHSGAISASDAYQLTSYAQAYQAEHSWLVYPVIDDTRQPLALSQQVLFDNDAAAGDDDSDGPSHAKLWLMPFNVLTGMLNGWPPQGLDSE
ncbi:5-methylcytosine-specific restriction enzyme subunit McrC [Psychrobacter sp. LV10R520-6]|nr:5-methylcytosine-specific restriction enzyme subunit McrC [Psychrobacter sp. LV10R520-6]